MSEGFSVHEVQRSGRAISEVVRPATLHDALVALAAEPSRRPIAGGTDLLLEFARNEQADSATVVDLTSINGFAMITESADSLRLGGGVTHSQVVDDARCVGSALPLAQACLEVGSPQLRNRATVAGNLVTASPANDTISALMALDASLELASLDADGSMTTRTVPVAEFFTGFRETVLRPGELIAAIDVPKLGVERRGLWFKVGLRKNQAISVVHGGLVLGFDGDVLTSARLALGSVAPTVVMIDEFAEALIGSSLTKDVIGAASSVAASSVSPISDGRGTSEYRTSVVESVVQRALYALASGTEAATWPAEPPTLRVTPDHPVKSTQTVITDETEMAVTVNGQPLRSAGGASRTLLDWLREQSSEGSGLWGTKEGCAEGECGACTVNLDGAAVMSCLVPAAQADGVHVVTIEGLVESDPLHCVQEAFVDKFAVQCGYCIPGFVMAVERLLAATPDPTDDQIAQGLGGNLCRCTGYYPITQAVRSAASAQRKGEGS